jgi:hypothetical protein
VIRAGSKWRSRIESAASAGGRKAKPPDRQEHEVAPEFDDRWRSFDAERNFTQSRQAAKKTARGGRLTRAPLARNQSGLALRAGNWFSLRAFFAAFAALREALFLRRFGCTGVRQLLTSS